MVEASLRALICDLLGEDPDACSEALTPGGGAARPALPTVPEALLCLGRGQVVAARHGTGAVALVRREDGRCFVVPDRCPHDGGPLSDGFVDGGRLVCARHGWEFDLETGACPGRPRVRLAPCELGACEQPETRADPGAGALPARPVMRACPDARRMPRG